MFSGCLEENVYPHVDNIRAQFAKRGIEDSLRKGPILDVGGGPADFINMLRFYYGDAILINLDFSHEMLLEAQDLANSATLGLVRATAESLPIGDKSIEVLHTNLLSTSLDGVTENFSWNRFIGEADRVLRPGGFYVFCEPYSRYGRPLLQGGYKIINGHEEPSNGAILQKPLGK